MAKIIKCKAAVSWGPNQPFFIEEIEVAPPKAGEVRIKLAAVGFCHSDLTAQSGKLFMGKFPCILGHEGAGVVESIGENVTTVKPGDHILVTFMSSCRKCKFCLSSATNICAMQSSVCTVLEEGTSRYSCKGQTIYHFCGTSSFSEYAVLDENSVIKVNSRAPLDKICLISCGVATGYGSAVRTAKVKPGSTCAVWGLGCIGLSVIMGCKIAGASRIIGVDINPAKFEIAKVLGCTECMNPNDYDKPFQEVLHELTLGGVDFTFECIGLPGIMKTAFESTSPAWGVCTIIGVASAGENLAINPILFLQGRTLKGSLLGDLLPHKDLPQMVEDYLNKKLNLNELITHTMPLKDINIAVELMKSGKSIRTVLKME